MGEAQSPYARALDARLHELHPTLRRYFSAVPAGHVGVGEGVFDAAGTPRRWLWPALRLLQRRGVVFAGWQRDVPFRVENRTVDGAALGLRFFSLRSGEWAMADAVTFAGNTLVDRIGAPATVAAALRVDVADGGVVLTSTRIGIRLGRLRARIPRCVAPVVRVSERFDDASGRQQVAATIDMPLLGRIYEYRGSFTYRIEEER